MFLNIDKDGYLLSVANVGGGVKVDLNLSNFDLSGDRINAHKWDGKTLVFDANKYAEIKTKEKAVEVEDEPTVNELLNILLGVDENE